MEGRFYVLVIDYLLIATASIVQWRQAMMKPWMLCLLSSPKRGKPVVEGSMYPAPLMDLEHSCSEPSPTIKVARESLSTIYVHENYIKMCLPTEGLATYNKATIELFGIDTFSGAEIKFVEDNAFSFDDEDDIIDMFPSSYVPNGGDAGSFRVGGFCGTERRSQISNVVSMT
ncbi:hypothetical protein M8C21_026592, partial [Ambrosia artemisiifolia]